MNLSIWILISCLNLAVAQQWGTVECSKNGYQERVDQSAKEAIKIARIAGQMLTAGNNNQKTVKRDNDNAQKLTKRDNDPDTKLVDADSVHEANHNFVQDGKVRAMLKLVLGDGEQSLDSRIETVAETLSKVGSYNDDKTKGLDKLVPNSDHNVIIACGKSHWEETTEEALDQEQPGIRNIYANVIGFDEQRAEVEACHDPEDSGYRGFTIAGSINEEAYQEALQKAENKGEDPPDPWYYWLAHPNNACTSDICAFTLSQNARIPAKEALVTFRTVGEAKEDDSGEAQIYLLWEGSALLTHVILHELSHTVLGGRTDDLPADECDTWYCVVETLEPRNADTIAYVGVMMLLYRSGYIVDSEGAIKTIEE